MSVQTIVAEKKANVEVIIYTSGFEQSYIIAYIKAPFIGRERSSAWSSATSKYKEDEIECNVSINIQSGLFIDIPIFDIGEFEVVNFHQWEGYDPWIIENVIKQNGVETKEPLYKEPALWSLKFTNTRTMEVETLINAHCRRDEFVNISRKLEVIVKYTQELLRPMEHRIRSGEGLSHEEMEQALSEYPFPINSVPVEFRTYDQEMEINGASIRARKEANRARKEAKEKSKKRDEMIAAAKEERARMESGPMNTVLKGVAVTFLIVILVLLVIVAAIS